MRNDIVGVAGRTIDVRSSVPEGINHHRRKFRKLKCVCLRVDYVVHRCGIGLPIPVISCMISLVLLLLIVMVMLLALLYGLVVVYRVSRMGCNGDDSKDLLALLCLVCLVSLMGLMGLVYLLCLLCLNMMLEVLLLYLLLDMGLLVELLRRLCWLNKRCLAIGLWLGLLVLMGMRDRVLGGRYRLY